MIGALRTLPFLVSKVGKIKILTKPHWIIISNIKRFSRLLSIFINLSVYSFAEIEN
jgi:hypothetical protein